MNEQPKAVPPIKLGERLKHLRSNMAYVIKKKVRRAAFNLPNSMILSKLTNI